MNNIAPVLKWVGGKRWFVSRYAGWLRQDSERYLEPFLGSGAVFFHLKPKFSILSDLNSDLIAMYQALKSEPREVWRQLKRHQRRHNMEYYYLVRQQKPRALVCRAARFIYLNRTCFNGLYRVNSKGVFNVPKGTQDKVIFPGDNFESVSNLLRSTRLVSSDFAETIMQAKKCDMLYVDPPYTVKHNNNNFLKYNEHIFSWNDQKRLASCLLGAAKRGACVLISNADHKCIRDLYGDMVWQCFSVSRFSGLSSSSKYRKEITELVISNYLNKDGGQVEPRF